jgi:DNA-binding SARP family transcriptional activator
LYHRYDVDGEGKVTFATIIPPTSQNQRIIERDAWDERAHLDLVACLQATGRHGEARRRYGAYAARMREIDLPAAAFPAS